jgi:hypothetical protein
MSDLKTVQDILDEHAQQARALAVEAERRAIHDLLMRMAKTAWENETKTPPEGYQRTTAAQWLEFAAGDVLRGDHVRKGGSDAKTGA